MFLFVSALSPFCLTEQVNDEPTVTYRAKYLQHTYNFVSFIIGLGTIAKSFWKSPKKTWNSFGAFKNSYNAMRKANVIGGNLKAHQKGNYDATKIGGKNIAAGISAFREQYKTARVKINPDWSVHIGDTRTPTEIKKVMDANRQGREDAG